MSPIAERLIEHAEALRQQPVELNQFTGDADADRLLNDIQYNPHFFVLACLMDQQIKAERAWLMSPPRSPGLGNTQRYWTRLRIT